MRCLPWAVVACLLSSSAVAGAAEKPTGVEAEAKAAKWYKGLDEKGVVIDKTFKEGGFAVTHAPSALGRITKFELSQDGWWISFAFKGEHTGDTPVKTLQDSFWFVALNRLPTPGLDLPGWDVRLQTPTSSIRDGVDVVSYANGNIKLQVKTKFFAIYGRDPSVLVPADAPSPPGSYFQIRKNVPLDLTVEAPFTFR